MIAFNLLEIDAQIKQSYTLTTIISRISELFNPYTKDYALEIEFNLKNIYKINITDKFLDKLVELQLLSFLKRLSFDYNCHYKTILDNGIIIY